MLATSPVELPITSPNWAGDRMLIVGSGLTSGPLPIDRLWLATGLSMVSTGPC
ncbi:hypothetical protein IQ273_20890 [Nodosilinea sp. LEGE 07298]|uniref:hypothetical protein n=1 Tax=Nodosilinea sp. LEGE 07298 TaxID=2777970 RepID=UPI00187F8065|nr:hypothetical protein [Nodosilinea sp. LEGE 07298]MBE9111868.1 hypothetical protein [Nodosilinea sp. LEGE 07298]